jgi:hypothetical protein
VVIFVHAECNYEIGIELEIGKEEKRTRHLCLGNKRASFGLR